MLTMTTFDLASAREFARTFEEVFYRGDHRAMASVYAADARLFAPGSEPFEGRAAIEHFWAEAIAGAGALGMRRSITQDEVACAGDLGYQRGTVRLEVPTGDGWRTITSRYVTLWRREADGAWRITVDISNTDVPVPFGREARAAAPGDRGRRVPEPTAVVE